MYAAVIPELLLTPVGSRATSLVSNNVLPLSPSLMGEIPDSGREAKSQWLHRHLLFLTEGLSPLPSG